MTLDEEFDGWPREREPINDTRVIAAVHGAHHALTRRLELSTRDHGLDSVEALILATLLRSGDLAGWELRDAIGLHRSTQSSILDRLELDQLIERRRSAYDGRRFEAVLTSRGETRAGIADSLIADVESEVAGYTSRAERRAAVAVFEACKAIGRRPRGSSHWD